MLHFLFIDSIICPTNRAERDKCVQRFDICIQISNWMLLYFHTSTLSFPLGFVIVSCFPFEKYTSYNFIFDVRLLIFANLRQIDNRSDSTRIKNIWQLLNNISTTVQITHAHRTDGFNRMNLFVWCLEVILDKLKSQTT